MKTYDAVFVGTGHNALVAAAYLVRAGWSVLMLERNDRPGGFVRTDELTLPGFRHDTYSSAHPLFVTGPAYAELGPDLEARGLRYVSAEHPGGVSLEDGRSAVLFSDVAQTAAEADRLAPGDGAAWHAMFEEFGAVAEPLFGLLAMDLASPQARELIRRLMLTDLGAPSPYAAEFTRSAREVIEERFRSPVLHALVAPWLSHLGRPLDEAGGAPWVALMMAAVQQAGYRIPVGGSGQLAVALARLIEDNGGEIRCSSPVAEITVADGAASGVRTAEGERFGAERAVVASTAPDQLYLELLAGAGDAVAPEIRRQAGRFRYGPGAVQIQLALSEVPRFADEWLNRTGGLHLTAGLDGISRSINEGLRGLLPATPTIFCDLPSSVDPSRVPEEGQAIVRFQILDLPLRPRGDAAGEIEVGDDGWSDEVLERFADRVVQIAGAICRTSPLRCWAAPRSARASSPPSIPTRAPAIPSAAATTSRRATCCGHFRARRATRRPCPGSTCSARRRGPATASTAARGGSSRGRCWPDRVLRPSRAARGARRVAHRAARVRRKASMLIDPTSPAGATLAPLPGAIRC